MRGDDITFVGHVGHTLPAEPRDKPAVQKNATEGREHPAANALERAPHGINPQDCIAEAAIDPCLSASEEEWQAAFPDQCVHRRVPNRQRLAMRFAQGMVRAVARGDFEVAVVFFNRLHNIPRSNKGTA